MANNQLRFTRVVLYQLSKQYGSPLDLYQVVTSTTDTRTGVKTITKSVCHIKRAIILPSDLASRFVISQKDFNYGGIIDTKTRGVILDSRLIPKDWNLVDDMYYITYQGTRYEFKSVERSEDGNSWHIIMKAVEGTPPSRIIEMAVYQSLRLVQTAGGSR